jgi:hypothetical protein
LDFVGKAQPAGGQTAVLTEAAPGRFGLTSAATWLTVLGALAGLSFAAMIPLSFLAHQVFNGIVPLVIGVPCAGVGVGVLVASVWISPRG